MPFGREPLEYPINRLLLKIGMDFQITRIYEKPCRKLPEKRQRERELAALLKLDEALATGLITSYRIFWNWSTHCVRTIRLTPHPTVRRTPGIGRLKELFLNFTYEYNENSRRKPDAQTRDSD